MMKWILPLILLVQPLSANICQEAFQKLKEGNARFMKDQLTHPDRTSERRESVVSKQKPFAVILGCSDSRVAPEILFDQGVGDLFVVRVAGNVSGPLELDSIEYAALHLGSCLVVVLGHENCGAVEAVVQHQTQDIEAVAELIEPAVKNIPTDQPNSLELAVKANVKSVVDYLKQTKVIASLLEQKKIAVVGGYYHLKSGEVEMLNSIY